MLSYSDDMGSCYMSSYFGDYSYLPEQMYFDSNGCLIITINGETQKFEPVQKPV